MKKRQSPGLRINAESVRHVVRQALSPPFLFALLGSFLLWYALKLGNQYTTRIPLNMRIDGQKYRVTALVSGRGSTIVAQRLSLKSKLVFSLEELSARPSPDTEGAFVFRATTLQRAINGKINGDIKVDEVVEAPEFVPEPEPDSEPEADRESESESK